MLGGGEDYVLLFTLPAGVDVAASSGCRRVGRIEAGSEVFLAGDGGKRRALPDLGWDHVSRCR